MSPSQIAYFAQINVIAKVAIANKLDREILVSGEAQAQQAKIALLKRRKLKAVKHKEEEEKIGTQTRFVI